MGEPEPKRKRPTPSSGGAPRDERKINPITGRRQASATAAEARAAEEEACCDEHDDGPDRGIAQEWISPNPVPPRTLTD